MTVNVPTPTVGYAPAATLTKREYFAAMALQGLLPDSSMNSIDEDTNLAVDAADSLIAALNRAKS